MCSDSHSIFFFILRWFGLVVCVRRLIYRILIGFFSMCVRRRPFGSENFSQWSSGTQNWQAQWKIKRLNDGMERRKIPEAKGILGSFVVVRFGFWIQLVSLLSLLLVSVSLLFFYISLGPISDEIYIYFDLFIYLSHPIFIICICFSSGSSCRCSSVVMRNKIIILRMKEKQGTWVTHSVIHNQQ